MSSDLKSRAMHAMPYWLWISPLARLCRDHHRGVYPERRRHFDGWESRSRGRLKKKRLKLPGRASAPEKHHLLSDLDSIQTIKETQGIVTLVGGATGAH